MVLAMEWFSASSVHDQEIVYCFLVFHEIGKLLRNMNQSEKRSFSKWTICPISITLVIYVYSSTSINILDVCSCITHNLSLNWTKFVSSIICDKFVIQMSGCNLILVQKGYFTHQESLFFSWVVITHFSSRDLTSRIVLCWQRFFKLPIIW